MSDVLDEAQGLLQCKSCPWFKSCVLPLRVTEEDLKRQLESSMPGMPVQANDQLGLPQFLASLAAAVQNSLVESCPIFIQRLRSSPKLAERIKKIMQGWSTDSNGET